MEKRCVQDLVVSECFLDEPIEHYSVCLPVSKSCHLHAKLSGPARGSEESGVEF